MQAHIINMDIIHMHLTRLTAIYQKETFRPPILLTRKRRINWIKLVCFHRAEKYGVQSVVEREHLQIFGFIKAQRENAISARNSTLLIKFVWTFPKTCSIVGVTKEQEVTK